MSIVSKTLPATALVTLLTIGGPAHADERPDHFKGLPANTLEEAVRNFSEHNHKLEAVLTQDTLTSRELFAIHELTYTLENALERINTELEALAETLEEVHVASETADTETVRSKGGEYLSVSRKMIP
ncbi:MAG: hypothetical protein LC646_12220 [Xanthomonadaceae bacterium]|nr:hypothetical protein [Xanthomonadaceae bacterium]